MPFRKRINQVTDSFFFCAESPIQIMKARTWSLNILGLVMKKQLSYYDGDVFKFHPVKALKRVINLHAFSPQLGVFDGCAVLLYFSFM